MEASTLVFADKAAVPAFLGCDVRHDVVAHLLEMKADKILLVMDTVVDEMHGDYFASLLGPQQQLSGDTGGAVTEPEPQPASAAGIPSGQQPIVETKILPSGDASKTWEQLGELMSWCFAVGATKKSVVVAFGGGALLNVTGLFASIAFRGMKLVYVPTTLLAMHDVVTSLKTSICFDGRKNNIGSFYAPLKILIDIAFCRTLPKSELMSGLGELAKNAALLGGAHAVGFLTVLSKESIDTSNAGSGEEVALDDCAILGLVRLGIEAKMTVLRCDAYEKQSGMIFEYGHTVSHALEKAYGDGRIPHGIGVTYGMLSSSYAAERLGLMSPRARREHDELCHLLLCRWPLPEPKPSVSEVMAFAMRDSKRGITSESSDEISDVLLRAMGDIVPSGTSMLTKFPCLLVQEWLESMGFSQSDESAKTRCTLGEPRDCCQQSRDDKLVPDSGAELISGIKILPVIAPPSCEECASLMAQIGNSSDKELEALGVGILQAGFANRVCAAELQGRPVVSKRYTDLVFLRVEREAIGVVDEHAGRHGLGPQVFYSAQAGYVEELLPGRTLEEADMHRSDFELLACVAEALAAFHRLPVPAQCEGEPMLWRTIEKMLRVVEAHPYVMPDGVPDVAAVRKEVAAARAALAQHRPSVVLGHGDCKPSNIMRTREEPCAVCLIDFELGGPNYRGFDLFKLFRTALPFSEVSMEHFLRVYSTSGGPLADDAPALMTEVRRFEPLTWLEAAVFFLTLPLFKPEETVRWNALALDRWTKYEETKEKLLV